MKITLDAWWPRVAAVALALAAVVVGCGGGVGEGGTGGGYSAGTISGLGSVFVNGVRFDDSAAVVTGADDSASSSDQLRLGMSVEVESGTVTDVGGQPTATASRVRYASELVGALAAVDLVGSRLTLMGQTVLVGAGTVFDDRLVGGLAVLSVGQVVEIYANFDAAAGQYRATRIEPATGATVFRLRGPVSNLDTSARTFNIGAALFDFSGDTPAGLANGAFVRLRVQPAAADAVRWTVLGVTSGLRALPEGREAKLRGLVTAFTSLQQFSINGQPVDATNATFPDGTAIGVGTHVEAEGPIAAGVVKATKVSIESESGGGGGGTGGGGDLFELEGLISAFDAQAKTFVVRGVAVSFAGSGIVYGGGTEADLRNDRKVQVKGVLAVNGTRLDAKRIEFK